MMLMRSSQLLIICAFLFSQAGIAQDRKNDETFYQEILSDTYRNYLTQVGDNIKLYNGTEYARPYYGIVGHPFFDSENFQKGVVYYDGVQYRGVQMAYDLVGDELIIKAYQDLSLKLVSEKITSFYFSDHLFIRIVQDSNSTKLQPGFYEVLNSGPVLVLEKRKKVIERPLKAENPFKFSEYDSYFIKKDNVYYSIDSKNSLISVFHEYKNEIKKFLRKNRLNFKKDRANTILKIVGYYAQLKK